MTELKKRLQSILTQIREAEHQAGRAPESVQLLAVSKTWPAAKLKAMAEAGQTRFGENYLQEALTKIEALAACGLEWHFIGPIQSNKTRDIARHFDWVHSVERLKIARRLNEQRPDDLAPLNVLIQINIDNEDSKSGISPEQLLDLARQIDTMDKLVLRGLMIIPAKTDTPEKQHAVFSRANQLFKTLQTHYPSVDTLSMGMSGDMSAAIAEGSTMVRIGTALFGQRHTPKPSEQVN